MFTLPDLSYAYDALEPYIDGQTMEIHHSKHHQWYVDKLNAAIKDTEREEKPLEELLQSLALLPKEIKTAVQNNGWWHRNHSLFRESMIPGGKEPSENMTKIIEENFWSIEKCKETFAQSAATNFWSGRTWIIKEHDELKIVNTANQNNPLMNHQKAILGLDVREHAYYLKYQNRRPDYIQNRRNIINRDKVEELYNK